MIGEKVSCFDISFTLFSLIGVVFIIAGGFSKIDEITEVVEEEISQMSKALCFIGALALPICLSLSQIINRKMKGVHRYTISLYVNPAMVVITGLLIIFTGKIGDTWNHVKNFGFIEYLLLFLLGCGSVFT